MKDLLTGNSNGSQQPTALVPKERRIWEETNLCEFPLTALDLHRRMKPLKLTDEVKPEKGGPKITRSWTIDGSLRYGIPIIPDEKVFLVGLSLLDRSGEGEFSTYAFCKAARIEPNDQSYNRFYESALRLSLAGYDCEKSFWDKSGNQYHGQLTFHLFDVMMIYGMSPIGEKDTDEHIWDGKKNYWKLSDVLRKSINLGNIKPTNLDFYLSLRKPISGRMYRYLDKLFYTKSSHDLDIERLAFEHLGMSRDGYKNVCQLKRQLDEGFGELTDKGWLKPRVYDEDTNKVHLEIAPRGNIISVGGVFPPRITDARGLVNYAFKLSGIDRPAEKGEIRQAARIIRAYSEEEAKRLVDLSFSRAVQKGMPPRSFGIVTLFEKEIIDEVNKAREIKEQAARDKEKAEAEKKRFADDEKRKASLLKEIENLSPEEKVNLEAEAEEISKSLHGAYWNKPLSIETSQIEAMKQRIQKKKSEKCSIAALRLQ